MALLAVGAVMLAGCAAPQVPPASSGTPTAPPASPGAAACEQHGGTVQERQPTFGTNNDESTWVLLGDPVEVCRFQTVDDDAKSRIYVDLVSISSSNPTLAALAYLAKKPLPDTTGGANPASAGCAALGGTTAFGAGVSGGGLVNKDDPDDVVFSPCTFADGSFIEEWGIAYYSAGTVRGIDLATVFAFDQSDLPNVFG